MELKGTNKIRNSQLDIMFNPRFNAYYRDLKSLNSRSTTLGKVVMKQCQTKMDGPMMVVYMHYHKNFQTLNSINAQQI